MSQSLEISKSSAPPVASAVAVPDRAPQINKPDPLAGKALKPEAVVETKAKVGAALEAQFKELEAALEEIRQKAGDSLHNLGFSIDKKINTHVVVVTDKSTGEVIRQIPNEVVIRVAHNIADLKGVLFDGKY